MKRRLMLPLLAFGYVLKGGPARTLKAAQPYMLFGMGRPRMPHPGYMPSTRLQSSMHRSSLIKEIRKGYIGDNCEQDIILRSMLAHWMPAHAASGTHTFKIVEGPSASICTRFGTAGLGEEHW